MIYPFAKVFPTRLNCLVIVLDAFSNQIQSTSSETANLFVYLSHQWLNNPANCDQNLLVYKETTHQTLLELSHVWHDHLSKYHVPVSDPPWANYQQRCIHYVTRFIVTRRERVSPEFLSNHLRLDYISSSPTFISRTVFRWWVKPFLLGRGNWFAWKPLHTQADNVRKPPIW